MDGGAAPGRRRADFATVIWLAWVLAQAYGASVLAALRPAPCSGQCRHVRSWPANAGQHTGSVSLRQHPRQPDHGGEDRHGDGLAQHLHPYAGLGRMRVQAGCSVSATYGAASPSGAP